MRFDIEKRLHRVKISLNKELVKCPRGEICENAADCDRCNLFFKKCAIYLKKRAE